LIFDEVITGFRLGRRGAQHLYGVKPDLTTLGKIIGGGLPIAAYGGRTDVMTKIAPTGPVYQAGTLSGNPLAVTAGIAMLRHIEEHPELYDTLEKSAAELSSAIPPGMCLNRVGSMFTFFCQPGPVTNFEEAKRSDTARFSKFFHHLLERGIYFPPSQFEVAFISTAHTPQDIAHAKQAIRDFV
jgi:glutamate-1-semialdehyde 2,1-aminomutase